MREFMRGILFVFLFLLLASCGPHEDDLLGTEGEKCKPEWVCDTGLTCRNDKCITMKEACDSMTCLHGKCALNDGIPSCKCDPGYLLSETNNWECVSGGPCAGVTCSDHGKCVTQLGDKPACDCDEDYFPGPDLSCVHVENPSCQVNEFICKDGAQSFCLQGEWKYPQECGENLFCATILASGSIACLSESVACSLDDKRCVDNKLETCNSNKEWVLEQDCEANTKCFIQTQKKSADFKFGCQ